MKPGFAGRHWLDAQERRIRLQAAKAELEKSGPKADMRNGKPKPGERPPGDKTLGE